MSEPNPEESDLRQRILGLMENQAVAPLLEATLDYLQKFPESAWGWLISVPTFIDLGRYKDARAALANAKTLVADDAHTTHASICYWRCVLYKEKGELKKAERWIRRALEIEEHNGSYAVTLGEILARRGKSKAARKVLQAAIEQGDSNVDEAHFDLAVLLRSQRSYTDALVHAKLALTIDPDYAAAHGLVQDLEAVMQGGW